MGLPLEGINVIDFTGVQAGPACTQLLQWFGATYLTVGSPIKFSDFTPTITGAPFLGEHTDAVQAELGYSADQIAQLHGAKVV